MQIRISHHLAYRQAMQTVIAAFLLGLVLSTIQIGYDVFREQEQVDSTVNEIINILRKTAAESLVSFDVALSENVVNGLFEYQPIREARVIDDLGSVFADKERPAIQGQFTWLVNLLFDQEKHSRVPLFYGDERETPVGHIEVSVDSYLVARNFFKRAELILLSDLARNVMLSGVLLLLFYYTLTRPLLGIVSHLASVDPALPARAMLLFPKRHEHDEMGLLVRTINQVLRKFDENLMWRKQAEATLRKHQDHLEELVKTRTEELQIAKEEAENVNAAKSRFLANMSHELRTPLNAVLGYAQILSRSQNLPPDEQKQLHIIMRSGEHLLALINDVLELSKIDANRVKLQPVNFDLHQMLSDLEAMFRLRVERKGLVLEFIYASGVPSHIRTDQSKLHQILINLLGNAVKYTEEGKIELRIRNEELGMKNEGSKTIPNSQFVILNFSVADTGVGIAPADLESVFDAFVRVDEQQYNKGTGLGLPISQKYVRMIGGDIHVESEVSTGSTFSFEIPVELVEHSSLITQQSSIRQRVVGLEPEQPAYRLLIVEDDEDSRNLLIQVLKPLGFQIREALNGAEAVELWNTWQPHLIWMDMRMPVMDGYAATKKIRNEELRMKNEESGMKDLQSPIPHSQFFIPHCKIIALTAHAFEENRMGVLEAGCDDFVRKPFQEAEIFDMLHKHLGMRFVYEEETQSTINNQQSTIENVLTPAALAALPAEWLATLEHGAKETNTTLLFEVIEQIRPQNSEIADALARLTNDFEYAKILTFIK